MNFGHIIFSGIVSDLEAALRTDPSLANVQVALPDNPATALPLHRVCDGVFNGSYSEETGFAIAELLLKYGADVNPVTEAGKDSPLTAAASLNCDTIAVLYIDRGARIDHRGCSGGTALHWASWCGRDVIVERLLQEKPEINQLCTEFKATPLFWALHGYRHNGHIHHQVNCARILLAHGADPRIPNIDGHRPEELVYDHEQELVALFRT